MWQRKAGQSRVLAITVPKGDSEEGWGHVVTRLTKPEARPSVQTDGSSSGAPGESCSYPRAPPPSVLQAAAGLGRELGMPSPSLVVQDRGRHLDEDGKGDGDGERVDGGGMTLPADGTLYIGGGDEQPDRGKGRGSGRERASSAGSVFVLTRGLAQGIGSCVISDRGHGRRKVVSKDGQLLEWSGAERQKEGPRKAEADIGAMLFSRQPLMPSCNGQSRCHR